MTIRYYLVLAAILTGLCSAPAYAHEPGSDEVVFYPRKFYLSNSFDGLIFTSGLDQSTFPLNGGLPTTLSTPRFTYFWNTGFNVHFDAGQAVGFFSGLGIKNIGFIEKIKPLDSTVKRRVYTLGVPLGIKFGNLKRKNYGFIGGGVDIPFNYKEKGYVKRGDKDKFNEWFSERTPSYMPHFFAGVSFNPGVYFKVQYYPNNFMNTAFTENVDVNGVLTPTQPYAQYDVQLLMFSIGLDIRYSNRMKIKHKSHHEESMM